MHVWVRVYTGVWVRVHMGVPVWMCERRRVMCMGVGMCVGKRV